MLQKFVDALIEHLTAAIAVAAIALTGVLLSPQMETITKAFETKPREMTLWTVTVALVGFVIGYSGLLNSKKAEQFLHIKKTCKTLSKSQKALLLYLLSNGTIKAGNTYDLDLLEKNGFVITSDVPQLYGKAAMINPDAINILQRHRTDWIGEMSEKEIIKILNG